MLEGAPGIGKTTLLDAVLEEAKSIGFSLLGARAEELQQQRKFGAIADAIRSSGLNSTEEDVLALLDSPLSAEAAFRLVDRLVELVEKRALAQPVLVWLDDVQWADEWTVRWVGILYRRLEGLPLAVTVATRRLPRAPETAGLLRILLEGGVHIDLAALDDKAVAELVRDRTGADPSSRLKSVLERAGGNPLFVRELLDAFERDGMLKRAGRRTDVAVGTTPPGLLVTVLHRMSSLPPMELDLVRLAAVLGGSFTLRQLGLAAGQPPDELLGPVLRLRAEGILWEEGDHIRFRHDLLREAVYDDLGGPVRNALHERIGRAFADAGMDAVEMAHHVLRGAQPGDATAADWMVEASRSGRVTLKESAALLRKALEVRPDHPDALELKRRLGTLLHSTDRPAEAIPLLEEVLEARTSPSDQFDVVGALAVASFLAGDREGHRFWRTRARRLAEGLSGSKDPAVILGVAHCHFDEGDFATATETAARAIALARAAGNRHHDEEGENMCSWLLTMQGLPKRALPHSTRALPLAAGRSTEPMRRVHHAWARRSLWELDAATSELDTARRLAGELGAVSDQLRATCESALLDYIAGRWDDARLHADTALEMMGELPITTEAADPGFVHAWIALREGNFAESSRIVDGLGVAAAESGLHAPWLRLLAAAARGPAPDVERLARELVRVRRESPFTPFGEGVLADAARGAMLVGDRPTAAEAAEVALRLAERADSPSLTLTAHRCRTIVERDTDAARHAVALAESCPWPLDKGAAFEDAAGVLVAARAELLTAAGALYEGVGSVLDLQRIARKQGTTRSVARPARPVTGWESLTEAELRVVELAAEGLTNREIGERLFVSHRTVSTHLGHIFDKLQIRSRVELAREAAARRPVTG